MPFGSALPTVQVTDFHPNLTFRAFPINVQVTDFNLSRIIEDSTRSLTSSLAVMNPRWVPRAGQ